MFLFSVLNVQMCIERDTSPKIMSVESVLMKVFCFVACIFKS